MIECVWYYCACRVNGAAVRHQPAADVVSSQLLRQHVAGGGHRSRRRQLLLVQPHRRQLANALRPSTASLLLLDRSLQPTPRLIQWPSSGGYTTLVCIVTKPTRSTQPCIPLGSLNRVPAVIGWGKGGNVTSAGWQVTLCDPIWHVSSRSGAVLVAQTAIRFLTLPYYVKLTVDELWNKTHGSDHARDADRLSNSNHTFGRCRWRYCVTIHATCLFRKPLNKWSTVIYFRLRISQWLTLDKF